MTNDLAAMSLAGALLLAGCGEPEDRPTPEPSTETVTESDVPEAPSATVAEPDVAEPQAAEPIPADTLAALEAMGYVDSAPTDNPEERGVTRNTPAAQPGLSLYSTRHRANASLIAIDGRVVHEWSAPDGEDAPDRWMHVEPLPGGDIAVVAMGHSLTRHRWDSSIVWRVDVPAHHDVAVHPDGRLLVLVRWAEHYTYRGTEMPVLVDGIQFVSADGARGRRVPLLPLMEPHLSTAKLQRIRARVEAGETAGLTRGGGIGDLMHTNSIEVLRRPIEGVAPAGSVLLSFRNISRVALLAPDLSEVLWVWGSGELEGQHDATQLDDGRLLIFDNGTRRRASRVIELDAATDTIVWRYEHDGFYTQLRGGAQRLANGNTLLTESDTGHAFEITRDGNVVWDFWNPDVRRRAAGDERGVIYRLNRLAPGAFPALAQGQTAATPPTPDE